MILPFIQAFDFPQIPRSEYPILYPFPIHYRSDIRRYLPFQLTLNFIIK